MANRYMTQFMYSLHKMPVHIDMRVQIGATGAVAALKGIGVESVTRLRVGTYQIKLQDNYVKFLGMNWSMQAPPDGIPVADGSFTPGLVYQITAVGDTDWAAAGLPAGLTPAIGMVFVAANAGGTGTGTAELSNLSGVFSVEMVGNPQLMLAPIGSANKGAILTVICWDASGSPVDPNEGSVLEIDLMLSNSTAQVPNE